MVEDAELEFLSKHPGGFDRDFFEQFMVALIEEFRANRDLDESTMEVAVTLRNGRELVVSTARVSLTWAMFITEHDEQSFVPHGEVVSVVARRRSGTPPTRLVGFSAKRIEEGA